MAEDKSSELLPMEGDPKVGKKVFEILGEIVADKINLGLHQSWYERYRLSRNMVWKNDTKKVPLLSANLLHTHRQRTVNTLTDNNPTFNLAKCGQVREEADEAFTKLQWTAEHWWRETEQQDKFSSSVANGEMYGTAIEKVVFDPDLEYGIGEVRTVIVDPYHFGVYPVDIKENQDAEANLHFYPMSIREAKRRWPEHADKIKSDAELVKELGDERRNVGGERNQKDQTVLNKVYSSITAFLGASSDDKAKDQVLIVECWVKDRSMQKTITEIDGVQVEVTEPKYPGYMRRVTVCSGGNVVLEDVANPNINPTLPPELQRMTYLYDKFPFTRVPSIEDTCSGWGASDWEQLEGLQKEFSKTLSQWGYYKDRAVRPKIINPKNSGVSNDQFTNALGILNPSSAEMGQGIRYLEMSNNALMAEIQGSVNLIRELFFLVAGTFELEQAQTGQVTAYKAIAALLEHAATMMRGKIRNYQRLIRERGRMYLSHVQNWYTEDRWISYEDDGQTQTIPVRGAELIVPAKLTVVSGSTLPRAQLQQREEATELFKLGAIDQVELLRKLEWPNRAEVVKRMQAGPVGALVARMQQAGFPPDVIEAVQQLGSMDDKEAAKAIEAGAVPVPQTAQSPAPDQREETLKQAEVEKTLAERDLTVEKVVTERVNQQVALAGIQFDATKLDLERKEVFANIGAKQTEIASAQENRPGYNESGLQSNNKQE